MGLNTKRVKTRLVTTTDSPTVEDDVLLCNDAGASFTITLPAVTACQGKNLWIKKTNSSVNTITLSGTIDGVTDTTLNTKNEMLHLVCDRSQWNIVNRYIDTGKQSFTPTGSWSTNVTYTGFWKRFGDEMQVDVNIALAGAPTSAALFLNMPTGYSVDTTKLTAAEGDHTPLLGRGVLHDDAGTSYAAAVIYGSTTTISVSWENANVAPLILTVNGITNVSPFTWATSDRAHFSFRVPILGWK